PSPVGDVTSSTFESDSDGGSFSVTYTDLPELAVMFGGSDTIYGNAKGDLLHSAMGKETAFNDATFAGQSGKELDYTAPGPAGQPPLVGRAMLFLDGNRLYVVDAQVPQSAAGRMDAFFNSF